MQTPPLSTLLTLSALLSSLQLTNADWKADLEVLLERQEEGECKSYMTHDLKKIQAAETQEEPCRSIKIAEPLFTVVTKCPRRLHARLERIMCRGVTVTRESVEADWRHRVSSFIVGIRKESCRDNVIARVEDKKDQTREEACDTITFFGSFLFTLGTGCPSSVYNSMKEIMCGSETPSSTTPLPTGATTATATARATATTATAAILPAHATSSVRLTETANPDRDWKATTAAAATRTEVERRPTAGAPGHAPPTAATTAAAAAPTASKFTGWKKSLEDYTRGLKDRDCQAMLIPIFKTHQDLAKRKACEVFRQFQKSSFTVVTKCSGDVYDSLEEIICDGGSSLVSDKSPPILEDWKKEIETYTRGLRNEKCKNMLIPMFKANKNMGREKACQILQKFPKTAFISATKCDGEVYDRLKVIACAEGAGVEVEKTLPPKDWKKEIEDYTRGLKDENCKKMLLPILQTHQNMPQQKACGMFKNFPKATFMTATTCGGEVYDRLKEIACLEAPSLVSDKSPPILEDWKKEIETYTRGLRNEKCKNMLIPMFKANKNMGREKACQILQKFPKTAFISATKCNGEVYDRLKVIACVEDPILVTEKTPPSLDDWKRDIEAYTRSLSDEKCKKMLIPILETHQTIARDKACQMFQKFPKSTFTAATNCNGGVHDRLNEIMCPGGSPLTPVQAQDGWKNGFRKFVDKLEDGLCKSSLLHLLREPKAEEACKLIEAAKAESSACSAHVYSRAAASLCDHSRAIPSPTGGSTKTNWKIELAKFIASITDKTCKSNLLQRIQNADPQQTKQDVCQFLRYTENVFQTTTKCSTGVYVKMEAIICAGGAGGGEGEVGGTPVMKGVASMPNWRHNLDRYIHGLQNNLCKSNLIAETHTFLDKSGDVDPCAYLKMSKTVFVGTTKCSGDVYRRLEDILCVRPPASAKSRSQDGWKSRVITYVDQMDAGSCKSSISVYVRTLTDDKQEIHPCKFIKSTQPLMDETNSCSLKVYEDLKEVTCGGGGTSLAVSSLLIFYGLCAVRYLL